MKLINIQCLMAMISIGCLANCKRFPYANNSIEENVTMTISYLEKATYDPQFFFTDCPLPIRLNASLPSAGVLNSERLDMVETFVRGLEFDLANSVIKQKEYPFSLNTYTIIEDIIKIQLNESMVRGGDINYQKMKTIYRNKLDRQAVIWYRKSLKKQRRLQNEIVTSGQVVHTLQFLMIYMSAEMHQVRHVPQLIIYENRVRELTERIKKVIIYTTENANIKNDIINFRKRIDKELRITLDMELDANIIDETINSEVWARTNAIMVAMVSKSYLMLDMPVIQQFMSWSEHVLVMPSTYHNKSLTKDMLKLIESKIAQVKSDLTSDKNNFMYTEVQLWSANLEKVIENVSIIIDQVNIADQLDKVTPEVKKVKNLAIAFHNHLASFNEECIFKLESHNTMLGDLELIEEYLLNEEMALENVPDEPFKDRVTIAIAHVGLEIQHLKTEISTLVDMITFSRDAATMVKDALGACKIIQIQSYLLYRFCEPIYFDLY